MLRFEILDLFYFGSISSCRRDIQCVAICGAGFSKVWQHRLNYLGQGEVIFFVSCLLEVVALSNKVSGVEIGEEKLTCMTTTSKWNLKGEGEIIRSGERIFLTNFKVT